MSQSLTGVLSCYDRVVITGTLRERETCAWCIAAVADVLSAGGQACPYTAAFMAEHLAFCPVNRDRHATDDDEG